jgi:hypothetical protein
MPGAHSSNSMPSRHGRCIRRRPLWFVHWLSFQRRGPFQRQGVVKVGLRKNSADRMAGASGHVVLACAAPPPWRAHWTCPADAPDPIHRCKHSQRRAWRLRQRACSHSTGCQRCLPVTVLACGIFLGELPSTLILVMAWLSAEHHALAWCYQYRRLSLTRGW